MTTFLCRFPGCEECCKNLISLQRHEKKCGREQVWQRLRKRPVILQKYQDAAISGVVEGVRQLTTHVPKENAQRSKRWVYKKYYFLTSAGAIKPGLSNRSSS